MNYQQQTLAGATNVDMVVALYDGWIRFLYRAVRAVEEDDVLDRRYAIKRALDIAMYLEARLRPEFAPDVARALSDFYSAMFTLMLEASHAASAHDLREVIACVRNVRDAWTVVAQDTNSNKGQARAVPVLPMPMPPVSSTQTLQWSA